ALVTGDALGQVSSQTLANLAVTDAAVALPVLRPLVGHDKEEIIAEARRLGTATLSEGLQEYCGLGRNLPVTAACPGQAEAQEARLDPGLLPAALDGLRAVDLLGPAAGAAADEVAREDLLTETLPPGALLIDCQPEQFYRAWHAPGALHLPPERFEDGVPALPPAPCYLLYCSFGTETPRLAAALRRAGHRAFAFRGGLKPLRRLLDQVAAE
ncbi:MAG TPA: rhodanese-like domain-containing protein, partial [Alphaproteobacteria bacterium]|nr:rhodanese-like domain-containing protein [Alphaproteobacteria bacterium]